jgi:predicted RNase H-like HicB family nuclease
MLRDYIDSAMREAHYEILEDGTYYGEIPSCPGVFASESSLEKCREILEEVLEGWVILGLRMGHELPTINGINLIQKLAA